jgi:hypothetical protein
MKPQSKSHFVQYNNLKVFTSQHLARLVDSVLIEEWRLLGCYAAWLL